MPSVDPKYNKYTIISNPFAKPKPEDEDKDSDSEENQEAE